MSQLNAQEMKLEYRLMLMDALFHSNLVIKDVVFMSLQQRVKHPVCKYADNFWLPKCYKSISGIDT